MRYEDYVGDSDRVMPFGKHRGRPLDEVPMSYFAWVLEECDLTYRPRLRAELTRRMRTWLDRFDGGPAPTSHSTPPAPPDVGRAVRDWYRKLAIRFHPDRGGSDAAMQVINEANDQLRRALGIGS